MRAAALSLLLLLAAVPAAPAKDYDVPRELARVLQSVKADTPVDVLLPGGLSLDYSKRVFAAGTGDEMGYGIELAAVRNCGSATACFLAEFSAAQGERLSLRQKVRLRGGVAGRFKPLTCGGSCSPPQIEWRRKGVLYTIQAKVTASAEADQRTALVKAANEALAAGPR